MKTLLYSLLLTLPGAPLLAQQAQVQQGEAVFMRYCVYCHGDGPGDQGAPMLPGTEALTLKYRGQVPALFWQRDDLSVPFIKAAVRNGVASMPPFRKTELTDQDIEAMYQYFIARGASED